MAKFKHLILWCCCGVVAAIALVLLSRVFAPDLFNLSLGLPIILYMPLAQVTARDRRILYWILVILFCIGCGILSGDLLTQAGRDLSAVSLLQITTIGAINGAVLFLFYSKAQKTKNQIQT